MQTKRTIEKRSRKKINNQISKSMRKKKEFHKKNIYRNKQV